ncbi:hypothetical protein BsWGS_08429 [Bradybaena similaris]
MIPTLLIFCSMVAVALFEGQECFSLSTPLTDFSQDLYDVIAVEKTNVVYSPFSIQAALGMTLLGAHRATLMEISQVLFGYPEFSQHAEFRDLLKQWSGMTDGRLDSVNGLFVSEAYPVKPQFVEAAESYYFGKSVNFHLGVHGAVEQAINDFGEEKTNGRVTHLLQRDTITSGTKAVLVNAAIFHGTWDWVFQDDMTHKGTFHTLDKGTIQIDMMYSERRAMVKRDFAGADLIELPFTGNRFALYIALPRAYTGLAAFENLLIKTQSVKTMFDEYRSEEVYLTLPKFKIESLFKLKGHLLNLGIENLFTLNASLDGISQKGGLYLDDVYHKAVIEVQENGTVPSAGTAAMASTLSSPKPFTVDHPFVFFLRNKKTNIILFQGKFSG